MDLILSENQQMYSGFCLHFSASSFWWWEGNVSHESAYQTQLKSRRMCLDDTGNVNHVERSPHFNFFGPRSMIFAAGWGSFTQSQLHGSCCWNRTQAPWEGDHVPLPKLRNYQATSFWDLWQRPINSQSEGLPVNFCTDSQKLCKIREGFGTWTVTF